MAVDAARANSLFLAALDLVDPSARAAYLDRECGDDADLRRRVEALLQADAPAATGTFDPNATKGQRGRTGHHQPAEAGAGTVVAGKYTLVEPIGEGGMGSVWRARQSEPVKRFVAVKLIKAGMDSKQVLNRFEAERQALAVMDHPNIAKVLDGGLHDGRPFFVMELVKGVPITEYCDARKLTPRERLELFGPVCQAIQHAHQKGIIHRDIKPSNVLVALYDDKPVVKVIDFGVAKATGAALTEHTIDTGFGGVVGTPQYMSPEQATLNNLDIDTRSDVYALGVLLYELLTGNPPFPKKELEKKGLMEFLRVVREEEPPRPSTKLSTADARATICANRGTEPEKLAALLRSELDWIVMKALEKDRARRYESALAFAADVRRYLASEAVQAHPPSTGYRLRKFVRRNKGQVIAASLVLVALLVGIAGTTTGWLEAKRQRDEADVARREAVRDRDLKEEARAAEERERTAAQREKLRASDEAETAQAVNDFLNQDLLGQANPLREADRDIKLRTVLDRAAKQIEGRFANRPLVEAGVRRTIGETYTGLGEYRLAVPHLRRAIDLLRQTRGADHKDTLATTLSLAESHLELHEFKPAREQFDTVLEARKRTLGEDDPATLVVKRWLGLWYLHQSRWDLAEPYLVEAREKFARILGENHRDTAEAVYTLGINYAMQRRYEIAERELLKGCELCRRVLGPDNPHTQTAESMLGYMYMEWNKLDLAEPLLVRTLDDSVRVLGADHKDTLTSVHNLALLRGKQGRHAEATELYARAYAARRRMLGDLHSQTRQSWSFLVSAYREAGDHQRLGELIREYRDAAVREYGPDDPRTLPALKMLAGHHADRDELAEAEAVFKTIATIERAAGRGADVDADRLTLLANSHWRSNRTARALAHFEEAVKAREMQHGRDHSSTLGAVVTLGTRYRDAGRPGEAVPLLEEAYRASPKHPSIQHVGPILIDAYLKAGEKAKAMQLFPEVLASTRAKYAKGTQALASQLAQLGQSLVEGRADPEAEPLLREALSDREKADPEGWATFHTQFLLGWALLGQRKYTEAEPLLLKGYEGLKARAKAAPPPFRNRVPEALDRLIELYTATSKPDEIQKWRAERAKYPDAAPPPREKE